jgi:hypothetical protein
MPELPRVLIVYDEQLDIAYKQTFERLLASAPGRIAPVDTSLRDVDPELPLEAIRDEIGHEHFREACVTAVLVGARTWQRKRVDRVVSSTLLDTPLSPRAGLIGILLPSYSDAHFDGFRGCYEPCTIPSRLHDNIEAEFASMHDWTDDPRRLEVWLHRALERKVRLQPDNRRNLYRSDRTSQRWSP